ncbi:MAG: hypothetical protein CML02_21100 [Pseudooceanicola sp.]|nr:hypothetical protein [Pseudooceanicola sp.]|tara:strand:- start:394 stop:2265 length:1872 start_codon:yes stop_codon:yes gene_type:complete
MKQKLSFTIFTFLFSVVGIAQIEIPSSYSNISSDNDGNLYFEKDYIKYKAKNTKPEFTLEQLFGNPSATENGVAMDFGDFEGTITYGLIPYGKVPHPLPVYRLTKEIKNGKVEIDITNDFKYPYDFVDWEENEKLSLGYRLIDKDGLLVYDGEISLEGKEAFEVAPSIYEGPFVNKVTESGATIWFNTTRPIRGMVEINGVSYQNDKVSTNQEINIDGLEPDTEYPYIVKYGNFEQEYSFKTAPEEGSRKAFVFGYTSDSRQATGGGERKIYGANAYIMKKMAALAYQQDVAFIQFTGDMINGYLTTPEEMDVQYTNWKKSIEPFWHYIPFYVGMGNHEAMGYVFEDEKGKSQAFIDGFPYESHSAETVFANNFVNFENGLESEDGSKYDPSEKKDFPSYNENVYYYTYANVAMIVLNSDYWYAPSLSGEPATSGGLHGYLMDNQLDWLKNTVQNLEENKNIDHVFVTQHTPAFPNGGHSRDDMWYSGNNDKRPYINGKPVEKGIIERRDEYLDILINKSSKVVAILTGDEHNYNWLRITTEVPIYPDGYDKEKLEISRPILQINNGASGAPYYGQEKLPWSEFTRSFSVENALCLFYVEGNNILMKVLNPDTLNEIDNVKLK